MNLEERMAGLGIEPVNFENMTVEEINQVILDRKDDPSFRENDICDGYHTFAELYEFKKVYNAALFNEWASHEEMINEGHADVLDYVMVCSPKYNVHKSWRHNGGELCFGGGWFIVSAMLPTGLISNHYKSKDWGLFNVPEVDKAIYPFDGHTGSDVIERLKGILKS